LEIAVGFRCLAQGHGFLSILRHTLISVFLQSGALVYSIGRFTVLAAGFEYSPLVLSIRRWF